ncbi:hypothetical protein ACFYOK_36765 [Microbispora bryophytorum]|uniref:hypothetical protein n=1 Tax=Microbispora bryophytorum TaxID=1460882 RepID=UPI0033D8FC82
MPFAGTARSVPAKAVRGSDGPRRAAAQSGLFFVADAVAAWLRRVFCGHGVFSVVTARLLPSPWKIGDGPAEIAWV